MVGKIIDHLEVGIVQIFLTSFNGVGHFGTSPFNMVVVSCDATVTGYEINRLGVGFAILDDHQAFGIVFIQNVSIFTFLTLICCQKEGLALVNDHMSLHT
jgi:type 1 fimbria pilin